MFSHIEKVVSTKELESYMHYSMTEILSKAVTIWAPDTSDFHVWLQKRHLY